jgi:hypothetical protein
MASYEPFRRQAAEGRLALENDYGRKYPRTEWLGCGGHKSTASFVGHPTDAIAAYGVFAVLAQTRQDR